MHAATQSAPGAQPGTYLGAFTFVLHSHLPFARLAGRWPHGEEWIHEAAIETYIPLLLALNRLHDQGIPVRLTLGLTPVLAEQLADPLVRDHLEQYLDERIAAAERDAETGASDSIRALAGWYKERFLRIKQAYVDQFQRDLIGAFRRLRDIGVLDLMGSAATHGYLPLFERPGSIRAQIATGLRSYARLFGGQPTAFWLPECGYRPGLEAHLEAFGIRVFFSETHAITGGSPVGAAAGDVIGPYSDVRWRLAIPVEAEAPPRPLTTFLPYRVGTSTVAVIGRDNRIGQQVWSAEWGYPGDFDYREFHRKSATSGLQYWRVTGKPVDLGQKDFYHPEWAAYKVEQHAEHFAHLVGDEMRRHAREHEGYGLISANFDTELFGHWWMEGVDWLAQTLTHLAHSSTVELTTASAYIQAHPPQQAIDLLESSWGAGGLHTIWKSAETEWMWAILGAAEARMEALAARFNAPTADEAIVLKQAARELLLLQSSDWPFLVTTGQAREYAAQRFNQHHERFERLASSLESGAPNTALAAEYETIDNLFPDIDPADFQPVDFRPGSGPA
ncbi:MAG: glycoside hydrolase family 57 protein [Candidatus Flexifilum sp.]|jgi:1,4-alpha-glucan branching enzyme